MLFDSQKHGYSLSAAEIRCAGTKGKGEACNALLCKRSAFSDFYRVDTQRVGVSLRCQACGETLHINLEDLKPGRWKQFHCQRCERFLARLDTATVRLYVRCRRCRGEAEIRLFDSQPVGEVARGGKRPVGAAST
jgi:hypothetical protein